MSGSTVGDCCMFYRGPFKFVVRRPAPDCVEDGELRPVKSGPLDKSSEPEPCPADERFPLFGFVLTEGFSNQGHSVGARLRAHEPGTLEGATLTARGFTEHP